MFTAPPPDLSGYATTADVAAQLAAQLAALAIGDVGTFALAALPDPAASPRRTAWVSDLYSVGGRVVSEGGFWKPIRPLVASRAVDVANMTTVPLLTPTTLLLGNAGLLGLGVTRTVTLGVGAGFALPYPGYRQRVVKPAGAAGTLVIVSAVSNALTGWADFEWDGAAWRQSASGGLL